MFYIDKHWKLICSLLLMLAAITFAAQQVLILRLSYTAYPVASGLALSPVLLGKSVVYVTADESRLYHLTLGIVPIGIACAFARGGLLIRHQKRGRLVT